MTVYNTYCEVSNYCTDALWKALDDYASMGFSLVSTLIAKNKYGVDVMYLFFTKVVR